ncbi:MAG: hypothetical protein H0T46_00235 [Deltaproteobacteria bacterium]|nr:hypothetical protein [Deltaproteobacteria bacterium]
MTTLVFYLCLAAFVACSLVNWIILVRWLSRRTRSSMILLVGGVSGMLGFLAIDRPYFAIACLALDPGVFTFVLWPIAGTRR